MWNRHQYQKKNILIRKRQASIFIKWFNKETVHRCQHKAHTHTHHSARTPSLSSSSHSLYFSILPQELMPLMSSCTCYPLLHIRKLSCFVSLSLSRKRRPLKILARKRKQEEQEGGGWCKSSTKVSRAWDHSCQCWVPARVPLFPFCSLFLSLQKTPAGVYISPPCFVPHLLQLKGKEKR